MSLPGTRMRTLAARVCSATTMERLVDPVLADLQVEYRLAVRESRPWKGRWTLLVSYLAFARVMLLCGFFGTRRCDGHRLRRSRRLRVGVELRQVRQ